jgi:hypothetical protein
MSVGIADLVQWSCAAYAACGGVFAVAFVTCGIAQIDPAARGAGVGLRLLLLPGAAVLWPVLLTKWSRIARVRRAS